MTRHDQSHSVSPTLDPNDPKSRFLWRVGGLVNPQDMEHKFWLVYIVTIVCIVTMVIYSYYKL